MSSSRRRSRLRLVAEAHARERRICAAIERADLSHEEVIVEVRALRERVDAVADGMVAASGARAA